MPGSAPLPRHPTAHGAIVATTEAPAGAASLALPTRARMVRDLPSSANFCVLSCRAQAAPMSWHGVLELGAATERDAAMATGADSASQARPAVRPGRRRPAPLGRVRPAAQPAARAMGPGAGGARAGAVGRRPRWPIARQLEAPVSASGVDEAKLARVVPQRPRTTGQAILARGSAAAGGFGARGVHMQRLPSRGLFGLSDTACPHARPPVRRTLPWTDGRRPAIIRLFAS